MDDSTRQRESSKRMAGMVVVLAWLAMALTGCAATTNYTYTNIVANTSATNAESWITGTGWTWYETEQYFVYGDGGSYGDGTLTQSNEVQAVIGQQYRVRFSFNMTYGAQPADPDYNTAKLNDWVKLSFGGVTQGLTNGGGGGFESPESPG